MAALSALADLRAMALPMAVGTALMTYSTIRALLRQSKFRYAVLDSQGKKLLQHPYRPWKNEDAKGADKAYASCRAYENSKEWLQLSLPIMWTFSVFGGALPYATQNVIDGLTFGLSLVWCIGNEMYVNGYTADNPDGRGPGFKVRTMVFRAWFYLSAAALTCFALTHFGLVNLP